MNRSRHTPAVTSLPQSPQDEATGRVRRYVLTMVIRMVCFGLTIFVTPYGWYTWVFAIATAVLPYIAVVFANAVSPTPSAAPESATQQIAPTTTVAPSESSPSPSPSHIITIHESPREQSPRDAGQRDGHTGGTTEADDGSGDA